MIQSMSAITIEKIVNHLTTEEFGNIEGDWECDLDAQMKMNDQSESHEFLGLHKENGKWMASHYVGHVWIKTGEVSLKVLPKSKNIAFINMFLKCIEHPVVERNMDNCFFLWPEKSALPADESTLIDPFIIARFLKLLYELSRRFIRHSFKHIENNLYCKVKGRVLVHKQIRENLVRLKPYKTVCQYQKFSMDTLENQILKCALWQCLKYLSRFPHPKLQQWASYCRNVFEPVSLRRIFPSEFGEAKIKSKGFYRVYLEPLKSAEMVLRRFGMDPFGEEKNTTPPYAIDMNELFERYCEVLLRNSYGDGVWAGYKNRNLGGNFKVRPDFLLKGEIKFIIDSKYKYDWNFNNSSDVYQVVSYSRHKSVLEKLELNDKDSGKPGGIVILYPDENGYEEIDCEIFLHSKDLTCCIDDFQVAVCKYPVKLPSKSAY
ncbi:MAG: hypothetical protein D6726_11840 [Nitrospirae bacterium]|nr:MAG: hypothetical protein D6726_11840 [Nitrospirota bacterium]